MNNKMIRKALEPKEMSYNQLMKLLKKAKLDEVKKREIETLAQEKKERNIRDAEKGPNAGYFFTDFNPLWRLAKYQLYREGHPDFQMDSNQNIVCEGASEVVIFDKMIQVHKKYCSYADRQKRTEKGKANARTFSELQELAHRK